MFLIFGTKTKSEAVPQGMRVNKRCPKCREVRLMKEYESKSYAHLFYVPIFRTGNSTRVFRCEECLTDFYLNVDDIDLSDKSRLLAYAGDSTVVRCTKCQQQLRVRISKDTVRVRCPKCRHEFEIRKRGV
jgi:DNA-directed RNA polymerase subunit RPC12/RpoP